MADVLARRSIWAGFFFFPSPLGREREEEVTFPSTDPRFFSITI
jgi:hypothetical protein